MVCERNGQYYLYGVISWGPIICGDKPGVFTNVAHVSDWLQSVLEVAGEDIDPGSTHNRVNLTSTDMGASNEAAATNPAHPPCDAGTLIHETSTHSPQNP
jgi:secreted trypsin-like serine protease